MVEAENQYNMWREHVQPVLQSKLEEFRLLGINRLTEDELWTFVLERIEKKKLKDLMLHQFVNHIMTLSINDYMNKIRMEMFKGTDLLNQDFIKG